MHNVGISTEFIPYCASAIHKHTHKRILKPFEDSEPTGLKVDTDIFFSGLGFVFYPLLGRISWGKKKKEKKKRGIKHSTIFLERTRDGTLDEHWN